MTSRSGGRPSSAAISGGFPHCVRAWRRASAPQRGSARAILALGARKVIAIERDARCLPALAEIADHYPGRLEVIEGD
ncbi:hypothetical protein ACC672_37865, partial [Rhizobium ruizarguesonis]